MIGDFLLDARGAGLEVAGFAGALVAGLSGFAFGLVVSAIWLYILNPLQTATLIIAFGLWEAWKFNKRIDAQISGPYTVTPAAPAVPPVANA